MQGRRYFSQGYWLAADWANLLSLKSAEVLTQELRARIVAVFAAFPWWRMEKAYTYLREQGVAASYDQVRQVARESGWRELRRGLQKRYHFSAQDFRPRDEWLVSQLLETVEVLLTRLEEGGGLLPGFLDQFQIGDAGQLKFSIT